MDGDLVAVALGEGAQGVARELDVVLAHGVHAEAFQVLHRGTQAYARAKAGTIALPPCPPAA